LSCLIILAAELRQFVIFETIALNLAIDRRAMLPIAAAISFTGTFACNISSMRVSHENPALYGPILTSLLSSKIGDLSQPSLECARLQMVFPVV
jgi:hypothetical protein